MKHIIFVMLLAASVALGGDMKGPAIGDEAPSFTLKSYDGKEYGLKNIEKDNKLTVLMFISTECPVSNAYNQRMKKLYDSFTKKGVAFVAINANKAEDVKAIAAHSKEHGFLFPVLKDLGNKVADLYNAQVTPETYVLNQQGKLLYHGRIDDNRTVDKVTSNDLADTLEKLLAGKQPSASELRAFGCSIKRVVVD